jgi:hypothetical protein
MSEEEAEAHAQMQAPSLARRNTGLTEGIVGLTMVCWHVIILLRAPANSTIWPTSSALAANLGSQGVARNCRVLKWYRLDVGRGCCGTLELVMVFPLATIRQQHNPNM